MKIIDNKIQKLGEDLKNEIKSNAKVKLASSIFSMYGYNHLKKELNNISELNFIFTDPTFIKNESEKNSYMFTI